MIPFVEVKFQYLPDQMPFLKSEVWENALSLIYMHLKECDVESLIGGASLRYKVCLYV